jgi:hypothetical protein
MKNKSVLGLDGFSVLFFREFCPQIRLEVFEMLITNYMKVM